MYLSRCTFLNLGSFCKATENAEILYLLLQVILSFWEMSLLLVLVKIVVAGTFGFNISRKITEERSTLRREFYNKFAKVSLLVKMFTYLLILVCGGGGGGGGFLSYVVL